MSWRTPIVCLLCIGCAVQVDAEMPELPQIGSRGEAARLCAMDKTVRGIDVSKWQGTIDWDGVSTTNAKYAFIRASYGTSVADEYFDRNWREAKRVGVLRGAYHFFLPAQDPVAQANKFLEIMGPLKPGDLPPVLDVEDDDGVGPKAFATAIRKWVNRVREVTGVMPIIYTRYYFWKEQLADTSEFAEAPLWVAHYTRDCPLSPDPWRKWDFWQFTDRGSIAGVSGPVDENLYNGTLASLQTLTVGAQTCPAVPTAGRVIDDDDPCFLPTGPIDYWRSVDGGHGGSLLWTHTTDKAETVNGCEWTLSFETAGQYAVAAHTSKAWSEATMANYEIVAKGGSQSRLVDQSKIDGWNSLGVFAFEANEKYVIRVGDNTGTPTDREVKLTCDALKIEPGSITDENAEKDGGDVDDPATAIADMNASGGEPGSVSATHGGELSGSCQASARPPVNGWFALIFVLALSRLRVGYRAHDRA